MRHQHHRPSPVPPPVPSMAGAASAASPLAKNPALETNEQLERWLRDEVLRLGEEPEGGNDSGPPRNQDPF